MRRHRQRTRRGSDASTSSARRELPGLKHLRSERDVHAAEVEREHEPHLSASDPQYHAARIRKTGRRAAAGDREPRSDRREDAFDIAWLMQVGRGSGPQEKSSRGVNADPAKRLPRLAAGECVEQNQRIHWPAEAAPSRARLDWFVQGQFRVAGVSGNWTGLNELAWRKMHA